MKSFLFAACLLWFLPVFAQSEQEVIKQSRELVQDKKYESAYKKLEDFDPKNQHEDVVLLKEEIALNYYVSSIMHQMFSFKDIPKDENIKNYRGQNGTSNIHVLYVDKILDSLLKLNPDHYKLNKGLGDFYYQVYLKYGEHWTISEDKLFEEIERNYKLAIEHHVTDFQAYYALGYVLINKGSYKEGIPYMNEALKLDKNSADAQYNIAYAYLYTNDRKNALVHGKEAIKLYNDTAEKADAARMVSVIYGEQKNFKKAVEYGEISNTIHPGNYYTLKNLLSFYFKLKDHVKIKSTTEEFYNLGPEKPTIYNDLSDIYLDNKKEAELIEFLNSKIPTASGSKVQLGSLYFYLGRLYIDTDKNKAREYLLKAKDILSGVYAPDHQVFKVIDETLKNMK